MSHHRHDRGVSQAHKHQPINPARDEQLQEKGRELVNYLFMYIRALQLYTSDNAIFQRPLQHMLTIINELIRLEGRVQLVGDASTVYINEVLIRFPFSSLPSVNFLLESWAQLDIGGMLIERIVTAEELQLYLQQFSKEQAQQANWNSPLQGAIRSETLQRVRASIQKAALSEQVANLAHRKVDPQQYAMLLYGRLLQLTQQLFASLSQDDSNVHNQLTRTLQELIDLISTHKLNFLGFTNETDLRAYEHYHICNSVFFAILFGQHLGLKRLQLLELGMSTIQHTIGKRWLPQQTLDKRQPLTPNEQRTIRKIGLYTVQELLKGPFKWEKVQRAIIASGVYGSHDHSQPQDHGQTLVPPSPSSIRSGIHTRSFSTIIRLCATFDALCTRRPYRIKLFPTEALLKMKQHLAQYFEPYLLNRFIRFFAPMALHYQKQQEASQPPPENRDGRKYGDALSVFGYGIQAQLNEYWTLRRLPNPTEKQREHLRKLRIWIDKKTDVLDLLRRGQSTDYQQSKSIAPPPPPSASKPKPKPTRQPTHQRPLESVRPAEPVRPTSIIDRYASQTALPATAAAPHKPPPQETQFHAQHAPPIDGHIDEDHGFMFIDEEEGFTPQEELATIDDYDTMVVSDEPRDEAGALTHVQAVYHQDVVPSSPQPQSPQQTPQKAPKHGLRQGIPVIIDSPKKS